MAPKTRQAPSAKTKLKRAKKYISSKKDNRKGFKKSFAEKIEEELAKAQDEHGEENFTVGIGAEAVLEMLKNLDLDLERKNLVDYIKET